MRTPLFFVTVWVGFVIGGLACWYFVITGAIWFVQAWLTWPVVRFASVVGVLGMFLFILSEQYAEMRVNAQHRRVR